MVKLADTQDLGSCAERHAGSIPVRRTKKIFKDRSVIMTKTQTKDAEIRLNQINIFFTAYGTFLSGLFCVLQYLFSSTEKIFSIISLAFLTLVFIVTYYIFYSKRLSKEIVLWNYFKKCSEDIGILNPIMLSISFILAFTQEKIWFFICILLMVLHVFIYIIDIKHVIKSK